MKAETLAATLVPDGNKDGRVTFEEFKDFALESVGGPAALLPAPKVPIVRAPKRADNKPVFINCFPGVGRGVAQGKSDRDISSKERELDRKEREREQRERNRQQAFNQEMLRLRESEQLALQQQQQAERDRQELLAREKAAADAAKDKTKPAITDTHANPKKKQLQKHAAVTSAGAEK